MKVLIILALTSVYLTSTTVDSISMTTMTSLLFQSNRTSFSPRLMSMSTVKPSKRCQFQMKNMDKIAKAWGICEELTGFPGNSTAPDWTFIDMVQANNFEDNCFGKCVLEKLKLVKEDGKLKKEEVAKIFKSNAPAEIEKQRIQGAKSCVDKIQKEEKVISNSTRGSYCKTPIMFITCALTIDQQSHQKCH